ncbi:MAG TPA: TolC family protein [Nitrospiria bacterium]|jgi:outer membrane protein TolC
MKFYGRSKLVTCVLPVLPVLLTVGCALLGEKDTHISLLPTPPMEADYDVSITEIPQPRMNNAEPLFTVSENGPVDLSIEQAVMLAIQNNRDLHVQQINPVIAGTFEQIERGEYDPEVFVGLEYVEERSSETARSTGTQFNVEGSDTVSSAGLRQKLPTGTTLEATIDHRRSLSDRTPEQESARVGLSLTQSLLQGFGPAVNLVSIRQADLETLASLYELRGFTETLLGNTEIAYWNYLLANQEIEIFEQSLAVARQQRDEVELHIEVGTLPAVEAAAARAEVSRRGQDLIDARSLLEENRLRLLRHISSDLTGPVDLRINPISQPGTDPEPVTDLADRLQLAERFRPDLREAVVRLNQNRLVTIVTRNGLLPRLELFMTLGKTGFADTFSDSFRELDGNTYDVAAGIRFSQFIRNRAAEGRDLAARASRRQAAEAVANLRQLVQLDVKLAINELERARQQISASRATRILQEETLNAEKERFNVGSSTALLVAQAQRDLLASQIAEAEAIISYRIALVRLFLAEGSLLERRGISLDPKGFPGNYSFPNIDWRSDITR